MSFTVQHKRSDTASRRPLPEELAAGQVAINYNNDTPGLFFQTSDGKLAKVGPPILSATAPIVGDLVNYSEFSIGELWVNTGGNGISYWTGTAWESLSQESDLYISVKDFGAVGDGVTDDTSAIQLAFDSVSNSGGGIVLFPAGTYAVNAVTGIDVPASVVASGAGIGQTIIKNTADNWRYIFGIRGGNDITIKNMTIDGDWPTRPAITLTGDTKRGEAIIFWNGASSSSNFLAENLFIKNTGHYGIGLQNVDINGAILTNLFFENIGGDCIDIKDTYSPTASKKSIIIDGIVSYDGCGHNASTDSNIGHNNQAVIDVGGQCTVSNVHIYNLDSYNNTLGNAGVRFRAPVTSGRRNGSAGSSGSNIFVHSSKNANQGTAVSDRIIGINVNDSYINVDNVYVENCYYGVRLSAAEDGNPEYVSATNLNIKNCSGSDGNSYGLSATSASTNCFFQGNVSDCNTGIKIIGSYHDVNLNLINNDLAVDEAPWGTSSVRLSFQNNTANAADNTYVSEGVNTYDNNSHSIQGSLNLRTNYFSTATSGFDPSQNIAGMDVYSEATGGVGAGFRGSFGLRPTGASNTDNVWSFKLAAGVELFTIGASSNINNQPLLTNYEIRPVVDNTVTLGTGSFRWSTVYAGTGAINTSDANKKQDIRDLNDAESRVAVAIKGLIKAYRFIDSVALKGDDARIHFGPMAQDVAAAFENEGLDPNSYALYCKDVDEEGNEVLGIRYNELLSFVLSQL